MKTKKRKKKKAALNKDGMTASKATLPLKNTEKTNASLSVTPARCSSNILLLLLLWNTKQEIWSISKENKLFWNDLIIANSD